MPALFAHKPPPLAAIFSEKIISVGAFAERNRALGDNIRQKARRGLSLQQILRRMRFLFTLLFVLMFAAVVFSAIIYTIARAAFGSAQSNTKALNVLLGQLRAVIQSKRVELTPWDQEMLPLLSANRANEKKSGWGAPVLSGTLTSIYHEPIVNYALRKSGKNALIVAQTSDREFVFRIKEKETEVWVEGQPFAIFVGGNLLSADKKGRLLAQIDLKTGEKYFPLQLDNDIAATILNPERAEGPNPRALTLLRKTLTREEEDALITATLLQHLRV